MISAALVLLLLSSLCNLLLPNYQGHILDGVILGDKSAFKKFVAHSIILSKTKEFSYIGILWYHLKKHYFATVLL